MVAVLFFTPFPSFRSLPPFLHLPFTPPPLPLLKFDQVFKKKSL